MIRLFGALLAGLVLVVLVGALLVRTTPAAANHMSGGPTEGYSLHIDADKHFGDAHPSEIAHHWCKKVSASIFECELFEGDGPHARLVGVEAIVPASVWKTFSASEQKLWHYHKVELTKIHAVLPDTPKDKQAGIIAMISPTYGKIYILWDPMTTDNPIGQPSITVLH